MSQEVISKKILEHLGNAQLSMQPGICSLKEHSVGNATVLSSILGVFT